MNIQELAKKAIDRLNAMSADELEKKFIEHGYRPVRKGSIIPNIYFSEEKVPVSSDKITYSMHKIEAANQPNYFTCENYDLDIAA